MFDAATTLSRVARDLEEEVDPTHTIAAIVAAAVATVPGAQYGGITLIDRGRTLRSVAPTDEVVTRVDAAQLETMQGPCVDAIREHDTYRIGDLATEVRWREFRRAALGLGIMSMLSFRLFTTSTTWGSLNLYSLEREAFDEDAIILGELFASHAAVALAGSRGRQNLKTALQTREMIATARGMLMQRHDCDDVTAFAMLVTESQRSNTKLRDVAAQMVARANAAARPSAPAVTHTGRPPGHAG